MPAQFPVEGGEIPAGGGKGGAEVRQARTDLTLRPLGPVAGAVARYTLPFEPLGPGPQTSRPFEQRGVHLRMGADGRSGPFPGSNVIGLPGGSLFRPEPAEEPADQRTWRKT